MKKNMEKTIKLILIFMFLCGGHSHILYAQKVNIKQAVQNIPEIREFLISKGNSLSLTQFAERSLEFILSLKIDAEFYALIYFLEQKPLPNAFSQALGRNKIMNLAGFFAQEFYHLDRNKIFDKMIIEEQETILKIYLRIIFRKN